MSANTHTDAVPDLDCPDTPVPSCPQTPEIVAPTNVADPQHQKHAAPSLSAPVMLPLALLAPHPQNPRLALREDVIEQICAGLRAKGFDSANALIVRPKGGDRHEVIKGHHQREAAIRVGLTEVPCWIRDLDDDQAYMLLRTSNAQGELSAVENGMHALRSGMEIKAYAARIGRPHQTVYDEVYAAEVVEAVPHMRNELANISYKTLCAIHVAPRWLWPAFVSAMVAGHWTVEQAKAAVGRLKELPDEEPEWLNDAFSEGLVNGTIPAHDLEQITNGKTTPRTSCTRSSVSGHF